MESGVPGSGPLFLRGREGINTTTIAEISSDHGFRGSSYHKVADIMVPRQVTIDESTPYLNNVNTSVDCYVSGIYSGRGGKSLEVKQRYTVFVSYSRKTQRIAMQKVREQLIRDFELNFPQFRISDVFLPEEKFIIPLGDEGLAAPEEFYFGSELFKRMSRLDVGRFKLGTEGAIYRSRLDQVRRRYGL